MKKYWQKIINPETIRYIIFGVLTTVVDAAVYWLSTGVFAVHYVAANVVAWIAAVLFAFITNKIIVFKSGNRTAKVWLNELLRFVLSRLFSLGIATLWLIATVETFGMNEDISKLISYVFVVVLNYITSKLFVFNKKDAETSGRNGKGQKED